MYRDTTGAGAFELWMSGTTNAAGEYSFAPLLVGQYEVRVTIPDGATKTEASPGTQNGNVVVIDVLIATMNSDLTNPTQVARPYSATAADEAGRGRGVQTGDEAPIMAWAMLAAAMALLVLSMALLRRRLKGK